MRRNGWAASGWMTLVLMAAGAARGDVVIYETGFEEPDFIVGPLVGQQGWTSYFGENPDVPHVVAGAGTGGSQAVVLDGSRRVPPTPDDTTDPWTSYYYPGSVVGFDLDSVGATSVTFEARVLVQSPVGTAINWIGFDLWTASFDQLLYMTMETDGNIYMSAGGSDFAVLPTLEFDRFYDIRMEFDYLTQLGRFWLDGELVATRDAVSPITDRTLDTADLLIGSYSYQDPLEVVGIFDDFRLTAQVVPEPSSLISAALGLAALAGYAGWRRARPRRAT